MGANVKPAFSHFPHPSRVPAREGLIIGIDLGAAGASSLLDADGHLLEVCDIPVLDDGPRARPIVSASGFAAIIREWRPERAVVEYVYYRHQCGATRKTTNLFNRGCRDLYNRGFRWKHAA